MLSLRNNALRSSRASCSRLTTRNVRYQHSSPRTDPSKSADTLRNNLPVRLDFNREALIGGMVGGSLVFLAGYAWYHYSGAKTVVTTANQTKNYFDQALKKTKETAPSPHEALPWLKETAMDYASVVPGGKGYVEVVFNDMDTVHEKHREEVDRIVREVYDELKDLGNKGFGAASIVNAWDIMQKHMGKIADLAKDAGGDILNNHPHLKDTFGGEFNRLKEMGQNYGPEAKKQVDETWDKIRGALKGGFSFDTVNRVKSIVQETTQKVQKIGDEAWQKAMEQAKPYLERSPQLKEVVEKNEEKLKRGNATELVQKIKDTVASGRSQDLEQYVQEAISTANESAGGSFESYFSMFPGGGSVWSSMSQLQDGAQKHGKDAERLLKEAMEEIQQVLSRKVEEGKKLAEKAKQDTWK